MKAKQILTIACLAGALAAPGGLFAAAQAKPSVRQDIPADLAKQAKIGLDAARAAALAKVPGGEVRSVELEKEHGKLIYSFDISVPGKSGIEEVAVSAITGKVISQHHETARDEKREAKEEKKEHHPPGR
jgi:Peptidase propeptide and YPEB domain